MRVRPVLFEVMERAMKCGPLPTSRYPSRDRWRHHVSACCRRSWDAVATAPRRVKRATLISHHHYHAVVDARLSLTRRYS